jgi:SWI/SNF-related matrix-associated actin-dependent regulator of chromatin subfamily A3
VVANLKVANSIIFSFWKKTLHIIASLFTHRGLPFVLIDGSVALADRTKSLARFKNDPSIPVLLMTLGTGAVGYILFSFSSPVSHVLTYFFSDRLNLAIASRIHIVEPQWNPSMESQAIGRALRLGQEKQVTIIRYIMQDTVEEVVYSHL